MRIVVTSCGKVVINEIDEHQFQPRQNSLPKKIIKTETDIPTNSNSYIKTSSIENNLNQRIEAKKINNILNHKNNLSAQRQMAKNHILSLKGINSLMKNKESNFPLNNIQIKNNNNDKPFKIINVKIPKLHFPKGVRELYNGENKNNDSTSNNENNLIDKKLINNKSKNPSSLFDKSETEESLPIIHTNNNTICLDNLLTNRNKMNINRRLLKKQISDTDTNLINYLQSNKSIQPSFINKINMANENELSKLDKICRKYFQNERENDILNMNIKDKLKLEHKKEFESYYNKVKDIGCYFKSYEKLYKNLERKQKSFIENKVMYLQYKNIFQ